MKYNQNIYNKKGNPCISHTQKKSYYVSKINTTNNSMSETSQSCFPSDVFYMLAEITNDQRNKILFSNEQK